MDQAKTDRCLFVRQGDVVILQVDDSAGIGSPEFLRRESEKIKRFRSQERKMLDDGGSLTFNGILLTRSGDDIFMRVENDDFRRGTTVSTEDDLISRRASLQWISSNTRPDFSGPAQLLTGQVLSLPTQKTFKALNVLIDQLHQTYTDGIRFTSLDLDNLELILWTDSSFANAQGFRSQLGYVIAITDGKNANLLDWQSSKSKRVSRSVMGAELLALVHGFDRATHVREIVMEILDLSSLPIHSIVDSKTCFQLVTKLSIPMERRLAIDAHVVQEGHISGLLAKLSWAPRMYNVSDPLTREVWIQDSRLRALMMQNTIEINALGASSVKHPT